MNQQEKKEIINRVSSKVMERLSENGCSSYNMAKEFEKDVDPSGIIHIKTSSVRCEPFEEQGVYLKDITTLQEAPRMGAGVMELDNSSLAWTLSYDEYDYVIEGELEIEIDGRVVKGKEGDIIYIPKGSSIHFQTPSKVRYAYFVYPADWQS